MIPAAFDYVRAGSAEEAVSLLSQHGDDAKLLAGGHSLIPLMKLRLASPAVLIDVARIGDLSYIRDGGNHMAIGALTRHHDIEHSDVLKTEVPILARVAGLVGDPQVRHRGTIGGSLAHGDPASDLPATVLALGGSLVARGPGGEWVREPRPSLPHGEVRAADAAAFEPQPDLARANSRVAPLASVRATRSVGTPSTSAARRAAIRWRMACMVGMSTLPPMCPHFFSLASWSSKWTPAAPASIRAFISSKALSGPPKPASASATIGTK